MRTNGSRRNNNEDDGPGDRAPRGGVRVAGRWYKAGQILPKRYWRSTQEAAKAKVVANDRRQRDMARDLVPQIFTFAGRAGNIGQVYRNPDQAIRESLENARFMRNDPSIMECLEARQRATALLPWRVEPEDKNDPRQKQLAADMTVLLGRIPHFTEYRRNLLEALWYGRYANQHLFGYAHVNGKRRIVIQDWKPLCGDKLVFRWDDGSKKHQDGQIGVRVGASFALGQVLDGKYVVEQTEQGLAYFLEPWERCRFAVHRHIIEDGVFEDILSAGRLHGVGIRDRVYWCWFQKQETMAQLMEVIERTGTGFTIYYYPAGNPHAKAEVRELAESQTHTNVILMPRLPGDPTNDAFDIKRIEPSTAGISALQSIVHDFFDLQIKRYILGQTLSSESAATGLGSGVADLHQNTFAQIVEYDAIKLEETLTVETLTPLKNFNYPWARDIQLHVRLDRRKNDGAQKLSALKSAWDMGAKIKAEDIYDALGVSPPKPGDEVLFNPNAVAKDNTQSMNGANPHSDEDSKIPDADDFSGHSETQDAYAKRRLRYWSEEDEAKHPRAGKGFAIGGQFIRKDDSLAFEPSHATKAPVARSKSASSNETSNVSHGQPILHTVEKASVRQNNVSSSQPTMSPAKKSLPGGGTIVNQNAIGETITSTMNPDTGKFTISVTPKVGDAEGFDVYNEENYGSEFRSQTPDAPKSRNRWNPLSKPGWDIHHTKQQRLRKRYKAIGINVDNPKYLRAVPEEFHKNITEAQKKWWAMKAEELGISIDEAFNQVPLKKVEEFEAKLARDFGDKWLEAGKNQALKVVKIHRILNSPKALKKFLDDQKHRLKKYGIKAAAIGLMIYFNQDKFAAAIEALHFDPKTDEDFLYFKKLYEDAIIEIEEKGCLDHNKSIKLKDQAKKFFEKYATDEVKLELDILDAQFGKIIDADSGLRLLPEMP